MFTVDTHNNVDRYCSIDTNGRIWRVYRAMTGRRYMVKNVKTQEYRVVSHKSMSNLY